MATIIVTKNEGTSTGIKVEATIELARKFSTGSAGWYVNGKVELGGVKYQAAVQAVVVGSKALEGIDDKFLSSLGAANMAAFAGAKLFKTGSTGFYATWKQYINGWNCQCSATLTMIGSSPTAQAKAGERAAAAQTRADEYAKKAADRLAALKALKASIGA